MTMTYVSLRRDTLTCQVKQLLLMNCTSIFAERPDIKSKWILDRCRLRALQNDAGYTLSTRAHRKADRLTQPTRPVD
jgi:hypothetical protein